jgi:hypothetical protein
MIAGRRPQSEHLSLSLTAGTSTVPSMAETSRIVAKWARQDAVAE